VAGNLALLRESPGRPLIGLDEMIVDLGLDGSQQRPGTASPGSLSGAGALRMLAGTERMVARTLRDGPQTADRICASTGLDAGVVAAALTMLQLRGWARVHGAMHLPAGPLLEVDIERVA
jgi:predicted Rossmann fold nucleotide-binding protein DprA/Smf involved in DNA uptake